jgi:hypothetical protein
MADWGREKDRMGRFGLLQPAARASYSRSEVLGLAQDRAGVVMARALLISSVMS